ncbi:hypothetical protein OH492_25800 [Vibrio chagasii]|nr:hypothetical protein [Vibrio chagasii]
MSYVRSPDNTTGDPKISTLATARWRITAVTTVIHACFSSRRRRWFQSCARDLELTILRHAARQTQ